MVVTTRLVALPRPAGRRTGRRASFKAAYLIRLAQAVLLAISVGGALAFALQIATWPDHPLADMTQITRWARNIQADGIVSAYGGVYPETYLIYPPGMAYIYQMSVALSERIAQPSGLAVADWLRYCVKVIPILGHTALALTLFAICALAGRSFWRGWIAATLYAWSPAALFDAAYWGQGDSLSTLLLVLTIGVLVIFPSWWPLKTPAEWRWRAQLVAVAVGATAGVLIATGSLVKPQTWVFLPLLLWIAFRRTGPVGLVALAGAGVVAAVRIVQPWVSAGRTEEMLSVFGALPRVMPSVSANGHNLWWLKLPGVAIAVLDYQPVGGFGTWVAPEQLTHATVGRLGFGLFALLALLRLLGPLSPRLALTAAAYTACGYFMAITQVHENHQFAALPLLAGAAALDPWLIIPFATVSVCSFLNMALHDFLVGEALSGALGAHLPWHDPLTLQTANAALNVAGFAAFTLIFMRRPTAPAQTALALRWRARLVMLAGVAIAGGALGTLVTLLGNPALAGRLWDRLAGAALRSESIEVRLGLQTPPEALLAHAAADYANILYTLAGAAAITATLALLAGLWWLGRAASTRWRSARVPGQRPRQRPDQRRRIRDSRMPRDLEATREAVR